MKLQVKIELLKFSFAVLNSIFLALGLSVGGCSIWILFDSGNLLNVLSSDKLKVVAAGLFLIGAVVVLVAIIGCVAAGRENRYLLLLFVGFIIVLILGQLFISLVLLINRNRTEQNLSWTVDGIISQYGPSSSRLSRLLDDVQTHAQCCGRTGPADWLTNSFIQSLNLTSPQVLPCSCFRSRLSFNSPWCSENASFTEPHFGRGNGTFQQSCSEQLSDWLQQNILTIVAMDVSLILLQIALLAIAVSLFQNFGVKAAFKRTDLLVAEAGSSGPDDDYGEQNLDYTDP
ncbi:tetraspanin-19 [Nematolebias whitei]|uniref:tetraspanin-19 n=1 Tax=Nematolebias whitei TaxID=451745 RepID=UPI001896ED96|nr:tetraspanin-19 [Nematolebias whitei]